MNKFRIYISLILFLLYPCWVFSENFVNTVTVYSKQMDKPINNLVILPADYNKSNRHYPVVYLLHGYGANYTTWFSVIKPNLPQLATMYNFIIVCPNGENSWYWNSPIDKKSQYDTYISKELIHYIDSKYKTIPKAEYRAITGFSMGGHGALWLTIQHTDVFGACGSMSGGVDIRPFPKNWEISKQLGKYETHKDLWDNYTVINQIGRLKNKNISIIIDCGESDFFIVVNERLHKKMLDQSIKHTYITSPGKHTSAYWRQSIEKHLDFFSDFFNIKDNNLIIFNTNL